MGDRDGRLSKNAWDIGMGEIKDRRGIRDGRYRDGQAMCLCFPHCIAITKKGQIEL